MLKLYAKAVSEMRKSSVGGTPSDWTFQWYTHAVSGATSKDDELDRIFPNPNDPNRLLAALMWDTCEAHHPGTTGSNFLPWHRAYLLLFEEIARKACGNEAFTLPYWDYVDDPVLPVEFRKKGDADFGALYVDKRHEDVNEGVAINKRSGVWNPDLLNLDALKEQDYLPGGGFVPLGFNRKLDSELHGFVHVNVGTVSNMGSVPNAAFDSIFWLHHSNIDRIWAAWNSHGGKNPTDNLWLRKRHIFADADGKRREITNEEVSDLKSLLYEYDALPKRPSESAPHIAATKKTSPSVAQATDAQTQRVRTLASTEQKVRLGAGSTSVVLKRREGGGPALLSQKSGPSGARRYLVIRDIETNVQPGVHYDVIARTSSSSAPARDVYVGSISFFDAAKTGAPPREASIFVFDLTEKLSTSDNVNLLSYSLVPAGKPVENAQPSIGKMEVIEK